MAAKRSRQPVVHSSSPSAPFCDNGCQLRQPAGSTSVVVNRRTEKQRGLKDKLLRYPLVVNFPNLCSRYREVAQ